jgi:signal transduction histidine kinase/CheY-like chemotaxis protein
MAGRERCILIHSFSEQEGVLAGKVLGDMGIETGVCRSGPHLFEQLESGVGGLLIVEELIASVAPYLRRFLERQPSWSDLPILVLTKHGSDSVEAQRAVEMLGNVTLLERPVRTMGLVTAARSALRARDRQYQVREADRRKDEFLATLAHELRNPLAPIRTAMSIFERMNLSPELGKLISVVQRQVSHLTRLVDDLLDVARISNGKVVLQLQDTTVRSVVTNATEIANAAILEKGHELVVDQPGSEYRLRAEHVRVVQSLANLLVNAAKFTPQGGTIKLVVRVDGEQVEFCVCDNGRGLAAESLSTIFEMFAQARSPGEPGTGLGIGLNLAKRFAELHGGTLTAKSEGLGRGSEFVLRLPAVTDAEPPAVKEGEAPIGPARLPARVLVVDDNVDAANTLGTLLTLQGISVALAYDGAHAVEAVQKQAPDVVLMDIGMPRLNGYDAARQIRLQPGGRRIRLIALTGWGQYADRHLAEQAGFDLHFVKPVDFASLLGCLAAPG